VICRVLDLVWAFGWLLSMTLPLHSPDPVVAVAVWFVVIAAACRSGPALDAARRCAVGSMRLVELAPAAMGVQLALDCWVSHLGSLIVLVAYLVAITRTLRGSAFPSARIRR
jgi:hypothetical protein